VGQCWFRQQRSLLISSNLPFSKWEGIFKDPKDAMTTAAPIDYLVHHCVILNNFRHHCKCQCCFAPIYSHHIGTVHSHRRNTQLKEYSESQLEEALIRELEQFLLELGTDFAVVTSPEAFADRDGMVSGRSVVLPQRYGSPRAPPFRKT
jgi:hypothetical protein